MPIYRAQDVVLPRAKKLVKRRATRRSGGSSSKSMTDPIRSASSSSGVTVDLRSQESHNDRPVNNTSSPGSLDNDRPVNNMSSPGSLDSDIRRPLDVVSENDISTDTDSSTDSDDDRIVGRSRFGRKIRPPVRFSPTNYSVKQCEVFV